MNGNKIIEASAGTGKTHRLASRIIALLRLGVEPQEIAALTFSRAAAGEIFERFVLMLAKSARRRPSDAALLRKVISTQHLSQIGTLDSFLMRMARVFPLELGLCGELTIMDDHRKYAETAKTSFSILRRTDDATRRDFVEAFSLAMNREVPRSFISGYNAFVDRWHGLVLDNPEEGSWDFVRRVFGDDAPEWLSTTERDLEKAAAGLEGVSVEVPKWAEFVEWVRNFRGDMSYLKGIAAKAVALSVDDLSRAAIEITFNKKAYVFAGEDAQRFRNALYAVAGWILRSRCETTLGVYRLISAFEREYSHSVRSRGSLVFDDIPRLVASLPEADRRNIEYRMDCRIRTWAIDEFQDTSRPQWRAIEDLIDEAKQSDGEKPVFIVGDFKQAIYGWRKGDVAIFGRECGDAAYRKLPLNRTYRSGQAVVDAVNKVFTGGAIGEFCPAWIERCHTHETARKNLSGLVQVIESPGPKMEDFLEPVYNALAAVNPVERGLEAAVLTRGNDLGREIVEYLAKRGMKNVEFEGECSIAETPVLGAFLDLVQLADHPGDKMAERHFILSPLAKAKYPEGIPSGEEISGEFARAFSEKGLVRTFRALREILRSSPSYEWGDFVENQFVDMLKAAEEFELSMRPDTRLSDFRPFLESRSKRACAASGKVRVMTIHHSKGLGFDYVILPLYEHNGLERDRSGALEGDGWVLDDPGEFASSFVGEVERAREVRMERAEFEELCTYYVAMTRAKRSMTVILHPQPKKGGGGTLRFSGIVRESLGANAEIGDRDWMEKVASSQAKADERALPAPQLRTAPRSRRQSFGRRLPSKKFVDGEAASVLFLRDSARKQAIERGIEAHKAFEAVEFVDAAEARDDFDRALVRPEGFTALWREKPYEILSGGIWESGQFDRVVFAGGRAVVQDFKTNRPMRGESLEDFETRMADTYRPQMTAYRRALGVLANLPPESISCELLLVSTRTVVRGQ